MEITRVAAPAAPRALGPVPPVEAVAEVAPPRLAPAVTVDVGAGPGPARAGADHERIRVDTETRAVLFQVVEAGSGTVVLQIPDERAVRARLYARDEATRAARERASVAVV